MMDKFMVKGLLTDNDLEKLNSMEGIIELLCDIPNFNMDMYEELDEEKRMLVGYKWMHIFLICYIHL